MYFIFFFFWSGLQCPKAYSLWGGVVPSPSIGKQPFAQLKKISYKNCTQLDSFLSELLHNISIWKVGLVHQNKLKPVLVKITQHHPVICVSMSYKLKYMPFNYFMNYDHIRYVWADRCLVPHKYDHKWGNNEFSNMSQYNVT